MNKTHPPAHPKVYHIVHIDRLPSIMADQYLWCDAKIISYPTLGTSIGMHHIKQRRLKKSLTSYPDLKVGDCVPFYFCPRSVMLFLIHKGNSELPYSGGQEPIIHLEADLYDSIAWAHQNNKRWVFSLSNAGANYFEDHRDLTQLVKIDWNAINTNQWSGHGIPESIKESKQAEFLMEYNFPWHLIRRVGVYSKAVFEQVIDLFRDVSRQPQVEVIRTWYY